jgi:hypothetical protein
MQGVDPEKFTAFNVLEDQDLRQGELSFTISKSAFIGRLEACG